MIQPFEKLRTIIRNRPVLVLGKGPTFSRYTSTSLKDFFTIGLNRVTDIISVDCSHCIDIDTNLCENFVVNANHVLIPWHPHVECKPSRTTIESIKIYGSKFIQIANKSNKLYTYNLSTWKKESSNKWGPIINAKFFSAEAIFHILCILGVKHIFTLGIDGGNTYAKEFKHIKPFLNGRKSFDVQMPQLKDICSSYGVIWERL